MFLKLKSLREDLLLAQGRVSIARFEFRDGSWVLGSIGAKEETLLNEWICSEIPVLEIYVRVEFPLPESVVRTVNMDDYGNGRRLPKKEGTWRGAMNRGEAPLFIDTMASAWNRQCANNVREEGV